MDHWWKLRPDGDVVAGQKEHSCRNNDNRGVVYEATLGLYRNHGDQDGVLSQDAFPTDPTEQQDSDGMGEKITLIKMRTERSG